MILLTVACNQNLKVQKTAQNLKVQKTAQNQLRCSNPSLEALNLSLRAQISVGIHNRQMSYVRQKKSWYVVILTIVGCYQILKRIPWGSNPILFSTNSHKMKQKNTKRENNWNDLKWLRLMYNDFKWCKMTKKLSVTDGQTDRPMDRVGHNRLHATKNAKFLVTCTRLYTPICLSVGWSVCWSVGHTFTFFINFISLSDFKSF